MNLRLVGYLMVLSGGIAVLSACQQGEGLPIISQVTIGQLDQFDKDNQRFSVVAEITPASSLSNWKLGFTLPRILKTIPEINYNTALDLKICAVANPANCAKLTYQKSAFTESDLSAGWTSIFAVESNAFPLSAGTRYTIQLKHIPVPGLNYSSLPQNWFVINEKNQVQVLTVPADSYNFVDYNAESIAAAMVQDSTNNWNNSLESDAALNLIPTPQEISFDGNAVLDLDHVRILILGGGDSNSANREFIRDALTRESKIAPSKILLQTTNDAATVAIELVNDQKFTNPEGYRLQIMSHKIELTAANSTGIFYAIQSLRQILAQYGTMLPTLTIQDAPRFKYRGVMLDSARHYFAIAEIKQLLDLMALQKLNTLHWHLSDDEAWRLEIPAYPQLTQIGAISGYGLPLINMRLVDKNLDITAQCLKSKFLNVTTRNQGSYSPTEVTQLIKYANARKITIIPEIDIPGHARALMKSLPQSFYDAEDKSLYGGYGDDTLPICLYNTSSALGSNFTHDINSIVKYIATAFNGQSTIYALKSEVSIGGDEINVNSLTHSPVCNNNPEWSSLSALQKEHKFFKLLAASNSLQDVKISGWEEFLLDSAGATSGKLDHLNNVVPAAQVGHVWIWQKKAPSGNDEVFARALAKKSYPVVLDYANYAYFDIRYSLDKSEPGLHWTANRQTGVETGGYSDTYAALSLNTAIAETFQALTRDERTNIHGVEGALWTDMIPNYEHLIYMAFPKMTGLAEVAWAPALSAESSAQLNWQNLAKRLGCGQDGFLNFLAKTYHLKYRGYPRGIAQEAPQVCR